MSELMLQLSRADLSAELPLVSTFLATVVLVIWLVEMGAGNSHPRGQRFGDRWAKTQVIRT